LRPFNYRFHVHACRSARRGVPDRPDPETDRVWLEEAERRLAAYRAGKVRGVPAEDIFGTT